MTIAFIKDWNGYEAGDSIALAQDDEDSLVSRGLAISLELLASKDASDNLAVDGALAAGTTLKSGGYTVATLPAGSAGMRAYVTDATTPTWNAALVGGGAVVCPAFHNGTAWVSA